MDPERLSILYVSHMPASPQRFGAQPRVHGLMTQLARCHELTAVMLVDDEFDAEECRRTMQAYCREVMLVPSRYHWKGLNKRCCSSGRWPRPGASSDCWSRSQRCSGARTKFLRARRFDVINLASSLLGYLNLSQASPGERLPRLIVDSHNIDYDLARQYARTEGRLGPSPRRELAQAATGGAGNLPQHGPHRVAAPHPD
jgi:hypothetical protein